jgi:PAS domain S-box-containing protein
VHLADVVDQRLRGATDYLPVLHLSAAYVTDEDKVRGLEAGADAYLTHPVDPAVLVATVQALVRTRVAEDALRRSEQQFRAVYERAPVGICLLDLGGRFVEANPAMLAFLGRPMDTVAGRALDAFVPAEYAPAARAFVALESTSGADEQFPLARPDKTPLLVKWSMLPHLQPGLNMILATDLTGPLLLEEQRLSALQRERAARAEAERIGRVKDEFVAVLSHELRTPLTTMIGWMQIFKRGPLDAARQQRGLEIIERNLALQARLVSDLLDMSSINLGKMRLSLSDVNVPELLQSAVEASEVALREKQLTVRVDDAGGCPLVRADAARVQQIASNLLGNAIKFSPNGGAISIGVRPHDGGVLVSFADRGIGISPDFLPNLFDRFSQADAGSNRRHGGLGLGLSIVRHLAESHDGNVSVASPGVGQGSTFTVWLPTRGPRIDEARQVATAGIEPGDPDATLTGASLLVVDDDADICTTLSLILKDRGADVRVASSYDEALAEIALSRPDVLLSDVGMPGNDGYALIRKIRQQETGARLPAIAITSYAREQDKAVALASGFDAHCSKPVRATELVHVIQRFLKH